MNQLVKNTSQQQVTTLDEVQSHNNHMVSVESSKVVQEIQASLIIAKRFPRDEVVAQNKLNAACRRVSLAKIATFSFPRGGKRVEGPSIKLLLAAASYWGNIGFGWIELERTPGNSKIKCVALDKETNTEYERIFDVKHIRDKSEGGKVLTEERDINEHVANWASRRLRVCLEAIIPKDIIDDAVDICKQTLISNEPVTKETLKKMLEAFDKFHVTKEMITKRLGRNYDSMEPAEMVEMRSIYNSLVEGGSDPIDWFKDWVSPEEKSRVAKEKAKKDKKADSEPVKEAVAEEENKSQLDNFKEKHADKIPEQKEPVKSTIVKKPLPPVDFPADQDGYPVDSGNGDPE